MHSGLTESGALSLVLHVPIGVRRRKNGGEVQVAVRNEKETDGTLIPATSAPPNIQRLP